MLSDIPQKAKSVTAKANSTDPATIADKYNITLWHRDLDNGVKGFTFVNRCAKLICINSTLSKQAEDFVIAHEIGHLVLHCKEQFVFMSGGRRFDKQELEADLFASYIMLSDDMLKQYLDSGQSCHDIAVLHHIKRNTVRIRKALCHF